ncbi:MAG: S8 family serine peptidase [Polaribacter sp.]
MKLLERINYRYFFFLFFITTTVFSQNKKDTDFIKSKSNISKLLQLKDKYNDAYQKMIKEANKKNIKEKFVSKTGNVKTLNEIINGVPFYDEDDNLNSATTSRVDKIWVGGSSGLDLTGKNIIIGHWEASGIPRSSHKEFEGRVVILDSEANSRHATHTAGTMIAKGFNSLARGVASEAIVHAYRTNNDEAEMAEFASLGGIISNHSYGSNNPEGNTLYYGYYSNHAKEWDEISYNAPYYLITKSAGNERNDNYNTEDNGYDILFSQSMAKNILVVGAVDDVLNYTGPSSVLQTEFSSYGPTDDWRIKPDIVANGRSVFSTGSSNDNNYYTSSGTSMAAPAAVGAIVLLQEHYHNKNAVYMKSATAKALVINNTDEVGANPGPDFGNGWGLLNAEKSAETITNSDSTSLILEESIANNGNYEFTISVDGTKPLVLTMVWTDVAATPVSIAVLGTDQPDLRLINDLDIRVIGNGNTYMPWIIENTSFTNPATKGDNFRDNVEKIEVNNIPAGIYSVKVTHKGQLHNSLKQDFSIVADNLTSNSLSIDTKYLTDVQVYPNPVLNNKVFIRLNEFSVSDVEILLYNITGRQVKKQNFNNIQNIELPISKSLSGVYFLKINTLKGSKTQKIIINN